MEVTLRTGEKVDVQCQEYMCGLYVCIYKDGRMIEQFGVNTTKEEFLKTLRKNFEKNF